MDFDDKLEALKKRYSERVERVLHGIATAYHEAGWGNEGDPCDMSDEYPRWSVLVTAPGCPIPEGPLADIPSNAIDVTFEFATQRAFEGPKDATGLTFSVSIVEVGGAIRGGMSPHNYTDSVWLNIDDEDALEKRFKLFEAADPSGAVVEASDD